MCEMNEQQMNRYRNEVSVLTFEMLQEEHIRLLGHLKSKQFAFSEFKKKFKPYGSPRAFPEPHKQYEDVCKVFMSDIEGLECKINLVLDMRRKAKK